MIVILGTAHLGTTPGKRSPDGKFRECEYSREIVKMILEDLKKKGIPAIIDYESLQPNAKMKGYTAKLELSRELTWRVNYVNNLCSKYGTSNCIYVSVHVNAAGSDGLWKNARGWSVYTSPGKTRSDTLATYLYEEARDILPPDSTYYIRSDWRDGDPDYEDNFYVLTKTRCPAVITENLFLDNKDDIAFLTSWEGKRKIVELHVNGIRKYINEQ